MMSLSDLVVDVEARGELVGRSCAVLSRLEVEQAGVVALVGLLEELAAGGIDVARRSAGPAAGRSPRCRGPRRCAGR